MKIDILYDSLYGSVCFASPIEGPRKPIYILSDRTAINESTFDWYDLLSCFELRRTAFLKQAGLAWLVFPCATHTRFAHSIGTFNLGQIAIQRCRIKPFGRRVEVLFSDWITEKGIREELLAALLLHDIGHFPFSHLLEHYVKDITHEDNTCLMILGSAIENHPYYNNFKNHYDNFLKHVKNYTPSAQKPNLVSQKLIDKKSGKVLDVNTICYLINPRQENLKHALGVGKKHNCEERELKLLKELVSGIIDIDRFEHYERDIFFSGVTDTKFNFGAFVSGMTFLPDESTNSYRISLTRESVNLAFQMLFTREILRDIFFENSELLSYEMMFRKAVGLHIKTISNEQNNIFSNMVYLTDDELLNRLNNSSNEHTQELVRLIFSKNPYEHIKIQNAHYRNTESLIAKWNKVLSSKSDAREKVLIHAHKYFGKHDKVMREWLDLTALECEGKPLDSINIYKERVKFITSTIENNLRTYWIFYDPSSISKEYIDQIKNKMST